jgi:queuine tRNA-ribosyltransferase
MQTPFFTVTSNNGLSGPRVGRITTAHGSCDTPCFEPIASLGTLRALSFEEAKSCGTSVIMANAWHVFREAGAETLQRTGGAHGFMRWDGIIFTDSGGYQIFSLKDLAEIGEEGVQFGSTEETRSELLTPEYVIEIQKRLGSDVMIALDDCAPYPCSRERAEEAVHRTSLWARKSMSAHREIPPCYGYAQSLFGIIQGGTYEDLRRVSVEQVAGLDFDGYGIGGLSIGMPRPLVREMTQLTSGLLPFDRPRHLLGVGLPGQILEGIEDGVDTFDCVLPIRKAQRGIVYTTFGAIRYKDVPEPSAGKMPVDSSCECYTCGRYSRSQLHKLYREQRTEAGRLASIHNLTFYHRLLERARDAIIRNEFSAFKRDFMSKWTTMEHEAHAS